jgi:hypothetical protein
MRLKPIKTTLPFSVAAAVALKFLAPVHTEAAEAQASVSEEEAFAIGVDAYLYFYPLVTMDVTRKQSTNIEPGKELGKGPMNTFVNIPEYPPNHDEDRSSAEFRHGLLIRVA